MLVTKIIYTFASAIENKTGALVQLVRMPACHAGGHGFESRTHRHLFKRATNQIFGALVQLVRMPACHAGGHGFESRTHRKSLMKIRDFFLFCFTD